VKPGPVGTFFPRDLLLAARGVGRLILGRPDVEPLFDLSPRGVVLSFVPAFLSIVPITGVETLMARAEKTAIGKGFYQAIFLSGVLDIAAFTAMVALCARFLGLKGWGRYLAVNNWANLVFALAFLALSSLVPLGTRGVDLVRLVWLLVLWPAEIVFTWNAARRIMGTDVSATVLLIVLELGLSVGADQVSALVFPS
jgi:hypothetical protein